MYASHQPMWGKRQVHLYIQETIHAIQLSISTELQKLAENFGYYEILKSHHMNLCSM